MSYLLLGSETRRTILRNIEVKRFHSDERNPTLHRARCRNGNDHGALGLTLKLAGALECEKQAQYNTKVSTKVQSAFRGRHSGSIEGKSKRFQSDATAAKSGVSSLPGGGPNDKQQDIFFVSKLA